MDVSRLQIKNDDGKVVAYMAEGGEFCYEHPYKEGHWLAVKRLITNRLLVLMDKHSLKTPSGLLWMPDKKIQTSQVGTILMKTDRYWDFFAREWRSTEEFDVGSRVLFRPTSGMPLYYGSKMTVWFFRPGSIMAMLENDEGTATHDMPITPWAQKEEDYPEGEDEVEDYDTDYQGGEE